MNIQIEHTSHNAPPAESLTPYFIRGVAKKRTFNSKEHILEYYNTVISASDIVRASSAVRYTMEEVHLQLVVNGKITYINIPAFFVYDGLSIGHFQMLASRQSRLAGLVHDWVYYSGRFDRETCDGIMKSVQLFRGNNPFTTEIYHIGVRLGGKSSYQQYRLK